MPAAWYTAPASQVGSWRRPSTTSASSKSCTSKSSSPTPARSTMTSIAPARSEPAASAPDQQPQAISRPDLAGRPGPARSDDHRVPVAQASIAHGPDPVSSGPVAPVFDPTPWLGTRPAGDAPGPPGTSESPLGAQPG